MKDPGRISPKKGLLSSEDVAGYLGVGPATVHRWCREGHLPCLKVGKQWRVRPQAFEDFLKRSERPTTLVEQMESFLRVPDNVLAVAADEDVLRRLDAAFFRVGEARGGLLVKFYGGEKDPEEELRAHLERHGLEIGRLEQGGRFLMRPERDPLDGRGEALGRILEEESEEGRAVWASFDWALEVDPDTALEQQERLNGLVEARQLVVKTAVLSEVADAWSSTEYRRAQSSHSGTILAHGGGLYLGRATRMPPS